MHTISIKYFYKKINKILERYDIYFLNLSIINEKPFWSHSLPASTDHSIILPEREAGFHVLLERWIIADTGMAFHQY